MTRVGMRLDERANLFDRLRVKRPAAVAFIFVYSSSQVGLSLMLHAFPISDKGHPRFQRPPTIQEVL